MDFRLTREQERLKEQFDDFFEEVMKDAPAGWSGSLEDLYSPEGFPFSRVVSKKLAQKGWLVCHWPKEYGGSDYGLTEQLIRAESAGYHHAPLGDHFGIGMLGPTLLAAGSEEQKREQLPPTANADRFWCQAWSEPDAGSDLASLTTRAVRDGDSYIIDGQKTWITGAHYADWAFTLVRTDPQSKRSRGLSFIMIDMKSPGVTVKPLVSMEMSHIYNEVYFDSVRVPVGNRVGEEGEGWAVTRMTMNFERSGIGQFAKNKRDLEELVEFCRETKRSGRPLADDPLILSRLAALAIEIEAGRALAYRIAWDQQKGELEDWKASAVKLYGSELRQRMAYTATSTLGLYGQIRPGSKWAPFAGMWTSLYQGCMGGNIAAGSSEIQRNIIAWAGAGLPRM